MLLRGYRSRCEDWLGRSGRGIGKGGDLDEADGRRGVRESRVDVL